MSGKARWTAGSMVALLGSRVKPDEALRDLTRAADRVAPGLLEWDKEVALRILDALASQPGPLGVSARFAKARLILAED